MPVMRPANSGAPEAREMPRHSGKATRKTTKPAGASWPMVLKIDLWAGCGVGAGVGLMRAPVRAGEEIISGITNLE
ncbi:hypothetical protein GCM10027511_35030 [Hymenobacter humi]